ncbi:response regulator transcription factor [Cyanobium sp. N.Huapi 1H5]|uniref:response regulator transcription factor n=1 Tax=Cyanobium sp. N.Huapi 1H5 TaxID=2823719 RepID=UPI0020CC638A|nr:response regulator transcription factor [Cyanobium sp. N.Huapi 1H5]MCP9836285.1 response regulator transcription factor [Cyanobium sp. N.Huapi 1H5]
MDLTDLIPGIPALLEDLEKILAGLTTVACLEHMKWLGAFMCIPPVQRSLVGAATTEEEGFRLVERQRPSLLVVSQRLQEGTGLALVEHTKALDPAIRTLLVADDANEALVREALARGCNGICFESGLFMPALRVVAGGGIYYPEPVAAVLRQQPPAAPIEPLTERERVVLNHLMLGLTDQRISQELVVSPETVRTHVKHIFQKLQVDNRTKAVVKSIAAGLINLESAMEGRTPVTG